MAIWRGCMVGRGWGVDLTSPARGGGRRARKSAAGGGSLCPDFDIPYLVGAPTPTLPRRRRAVPGMIHYAAAHARQIQREPDTFWLSRHRKRAGHAICE